MNKIRNSMLILIVIAAGACKLPKPLAMPESRALPEPVQDTLTPGKLTQVFADPQLKALIDTALSNNNDLLAAARRVEAAQATFYAARAAALPSLDIAVAAGVERYGEYTMNGVGNYDTNLSPNISKDQRIPDKVPDYFLGLRSSWEIDLWGKLKSRRKAAYARFLASREGQRLLKTQVVSGVAGMYYELTALDQELEIIRRNIVLQESAVATVNIQKAGGRATELAVQQFTAQLLSTRALAFHVKQDIAALENQLNGALGRFNAAIPRKATESMPDTVSGGIPVQLLLQRPDVRQAEMELAASKADVDAARAAFLPSLTLTPYAGFNAFKAGLLFQTPASIAWGIAGGITAPVFNKRQLKTQFNINNSGAQAAFYEWQQTIVDSYQEIATVLNRVGNQYQASLLKDKEVTVLKGAVSIAQTLYSTGYASYLEVIAAQKSVLEAELALVTSRKQVYMGLVQLHRALGGQESMD